MSFSYNDDLSTDLDYVRFQIGDTIENAGVKPNKSNFSDEELGSLITIEGSKERAVASAFEALASLWARYIDTEIGARDEKLSQVAKRYGDLAKKWRDGTLGGEGKTVNVEVVQWSFRGLGENE